ncbi:MAG: hypothetical protein AAB776_01425 [Patescibacteria group bacterium]
MESPLRRSAGGRQSAWTLEEVQAGLSYFKSEHGRFPKVSEFDQCEYLPSGRSIQRSFGGWNALRLKLGIEELYASGEYRSNIAHRINKRAQIIEDDIHAELIKMFGEIAVHREKPVPGCKERLDFVIYAKDSIIGVDVFWAETIQNLRSIINIKQKKYTGLEHPVVFVCVNDLLTSAMIDSVISAKDVKLPGNYSVMSRGAFIRLCIGLEPRF